jgi:hypothetical protein
MKLSEMSTPSTKKINKFMESRFGFAIDYSKMTVKKAQILSNTIEENLTKIRHSSALHTAEKNPRYMEMITVQENLNRWLNNKSQFRRLNEGEVGNAEVLLAAKDLVDSVQDIIEKVSKMQNVQLPQLLDSIRDQVGSAQADSFKGAVGTTLSTLMDQLGVARDGVSSGVRALSGEQVDQPMDMGGEVPPAGGGLPPEGGDIGGGVPQDDMGALSGEETDGFNATDAAVGGAEELGRARR